MYTTTQIFGPFSSPKEYILTVKANGGSVAISVEHADGVFMPSTTVTVDSAQRFFMGCAKVKLTPSGGAEFGLS